MRLVILVSGSGSNLQSLINAERSNNLGAATIVGVCSDKPNIFALERARLAHVPSATVIYRKPHSKLLFEEKLRKVVLTFKPDLIVLAGFMRILGKAFIDQFDNQIINIHPSLLPNFKGLNTHSRVIFFGCKQTGATVHWVNYKLDDGSIIAQKKTHVLKTDTPKILAERVLAIEHKLYPYVIKNLSLGKLP